jgi:hypothetical protein
MGTPEYSNSREGTIVAVGPGWDVGVAPPGVACEVSTVGEGAGVEMGDGTSVGVGSGPEQAARIRAAANIRIGRTDIIPGARPGLIIWMKRRLTILLPMMD